MMTEYIYLYVGRRQNFCAHLSCLPSFDRAALLWFWTTKAILPFRTAHSLDSYSVHSTLTY